MVVVAGLAALVIFVVGMIAGVIVLVSAASLTEDRKRRLSIEAPDRWTAAGRYLSKLYIRRSNVKRPSGDDPCDHDPGRFTGQSS